MQALAVDPGSTTGWAVAEASGAYALEQPGDAKLPGPLRHGRWFGRARQWLDSTIDLYRVEVIALERQLVIPGRGSFVTLGLRGVFLEVAERRRIMVDEVEIAAWQRWAKAYGWVKHAKKHGGDEVDAAAILAWWTAERLPKVEHGE